MKPFKSLSSKYESLELDNPRMSKGGHQGESTRDAAAIYPSLSVKPPKSFDFSKFEEFPRWLKRFERYRFISDLSKQERALQVNALLYALGGESEDIFTSFTFDDSADQKNYVPVKEKLDHHFILGFHMTSSKLKNKELSILLVLILILSVIRTSEDSSFCKFSV